MISTCSKRLIALPLLLLVLLILLKHVFNVNFLFVWLLLDFIVEIVKEKALLAWIKFWFRYDSSLQNNGRGYTCWLLGMFLAWLFVSLVHLIEHILMLMLLRILLICLHHLRELTDLILCLPCRFMFLLGFTTSLLLLEYFGKTKGLVFLLQFVLGGLGRNLWSQVLIRRTLLLFLVHLRESMRRGLLARKGACLWWHRMWFLRILYCLRLWGCPLKILWRNN